MERKIRKGWEVFSYFPPVLVRLLAREKVGKSSVRVLSDEEIAIRSGLAIETVTEVSEQLNWEDVPIGIAKRFCNGCNFDFFDWRVRNSAYALANGGSFAYLKCSPFWKSKYLPLLKKYINAKKEKVFN
tara:strand:+ start:14433 stop:14819 length:387 start_codon:yes stop_codon:yes gene_type:complete